jgi:hypothetical protein
VKSPCSLATDGNVNSHFLTAGNDGFFQLDLGIDHQIDRVEFYNRVDCCAANAIGIKVELLSSDNVVYARSYITSDVANTTLKFTMATPPICDISFRGGGWLLVRHLNRGSENWFQANDDLRGFDVYGDYSEGINATFQLSISFRALVNASTEFLFSTGSLFWLLSLPVLLVFDFVSPIQGDRSLWMITTFFEFNNNGSRLVETKRQISQSSHSLISCKRSEFWSDVVILICTRIESRSNRVLERS